ncbi:MAG: DUF1697 domain-containing protein [Phycisphaeraceae bacterium]|nr:DUF1697 domain-containing protein [Phycisphaeraceae bacterium]
MPTAIALLRGINVGSTRSLPMERLRALCEQVGMHDPRTYIQSGSVIFEAAKRDLSAVAERLEAAIEADRGFRPSVVVRTRDELAAAIDGSPFAARAKTDAAKLLVMFLKSKPAAGAQQALDGVKRGTEQMRLVGRELFIDFPDGIGKAKVSLAAVEKAIGVPATGRNWNTVLSLLAMADEG